MKSKNTGAPGPRSSLGLLSFNEASKSLIKLTPELVITISLVFGLIFLVLSFF
jgi:preprotein translocase subunit Sec61beta